MLGAVVVLIAWLTGSGLARSLPEAIELGKVFGGTDGHKYVNGVLDKLAAIPGFRTDLDLPRVREALTKVGAALFAQTDTIAPADRILYALRDVTGTVENISLIVASILSKKLASGTTGIVFDAFTGNRDVDTYPLENITVPTLIVQGVLMTDLVKAADVVLLVDRLDRLVLAIGIARRSRRIAVQSVVAGMGLSIVAMAVAAIGLLPPAPGALLQEGIDIAVILNALRAARG